MPWIALSLFFCWLIFREFRSHSVDRAGYDGPDPTPIWKPYIALMATLALLCAWPPFNYWRIERLLSAKATQLAEFHVARVHCNTVFDTLFDPESLTIGHARPDNGEIVFQYPWCDTIMAYRAHPQRASRQELISLNVLTHESMHVRGELNESVTECQAVRGTSARRAFLGFRQILHARTRVTTTKRSTKSGSMPAASKRPIFLSSAHRTKPSTSTWRTRPGQHRDGEQISDAASNLRKS